MWGSASTSPSARRCRPTVSWAETTWPWGPARSGSTRFGRGGTATAITTRQDVEELFRFIPATSPLTDAACASTPMIDTQRQARWADGAGTTHQYNHYYMPNDPTPPCSSRAGL